MMWYRTALQLPPNSSNLLVWMDANDLSVSDGISVPSMPNKGALGGSWNVTSVASGYQQILAPLASTIDGKRALSFPSEWVLYPASNILGITEAFVTGSLYGYNNSTFNFPTTNAANGNGITQIIIVRNIYNTTSYTGAPWNLFATLGYQGWDGDPYNPTSYITYWSNTAINGGGSSSRRWRYTETKTDGIGTTHENDFWDSDGANMPDLYGEFHAICFKLSTSLPQQKKISIFKRNGTDWEPVSSGQPISYPGATDLGILAGQVGIGCYAGIGNFSGRTYPSNGTGPNSGGRRPGGLACWYSELLVWNSLVSDADIKLYLTNKYGGSW